MSPSDLPWLFERSACSRDTGAQRVPRQKLRSTLSLLTFLRGQERAVARRAIAKATGAASSVAQELEAKETKPAAPLNVWQQAIDEELVSTHLGVALNDATFEGAQKAIRELVCWHIDVATNPATNGGQRLTDAKPTTGELVMDVRCEGCGYKTHHREHMGCVRAAKQHTQPAQGDKT